jgi:hypothetical protein
MPLSNRLWAALMFIAALLAWLAMLWLMFADVL